MMNKSIRVEPALKSRRLLSFLIDLGAMVASTFLLFLLFLYAIVGPIMGYQGKCEYMSEKNSQYNLNIPNGHVYTEYKDVLQKFYLEYFPTEIENNIKELYPEENYQSITHIYNVFVLNLPLNPTPEGDKFKGDLFQYQLSEDGVVLVNEIGINRPDMSGLNYENNLRDMLYGKYNKLNEMLARYSPQYQEAYFTKKNAEFISRVTAASISVIVFALVLPLIFKNGQTLGNKAEHIGIVNSKTGFRMPAYKNIFRMLVLYLIPVFGVSLNNRYGYIIFVIFPLFISLLLMLFKESGSDLADIITRTMAIDMDNSIIFGSPGEAMVYEKNPDNQVIEDKEYIEALESVEEFDLSTSRDENIKKDK